MKKISDIGTLAFRLAMGFTFLSAVASRLGLWGVYSSGWTNFLKYTAEVNSFAPTSVIPFLAATSTALEIILGLALIAGFKTRTAAFGSAVLTFIYAAAMTWSFGLKSSFDYSVFADAAANFILGTFPYYRWSADSFLIQKKLINKE